MIRREWVIPCPHCGAALPLTAERFNPQASAYPCGCGRSIDLAAMRKLNRVGHWRGLVGGAGQGTRGVAYRMPYLGPVVRHRWAAIKPIFAWYDCWVGLFWDTKKSTLYFFPLPMLGLKITVWGGKCWVLMKRGYFWRPNDAGYTEHIGEARRYTKGEALERARGGEEPVTMHHISEFIS